METFQNELISFCIITLVVLMLAYFTHKKEQQYKNIEASKKPHKKESSKTENTTD